MNKTSHILLLHDHAAVDVDRLAGDIRRRRIQRQKSHHARDIFRLTVFPGWNCRQDLCLDFWP